MTAIERVTAESAGGAVAMLLNRRAENQSPAFQGELEAFTRILDAFLESTELSVTIGFTDTAATVGLPAQAPPDEVESTEEVDKEDSAPLVTTVRVDGQFTDTTPISLSKHHVMVGPYVAWSLPVALRSSQ